LASPPNLPAGKTIVFTQDLSSSSLSYYHLQHANGEEFCSDFLHICLLGEQVENGIVRLNIDFLNCIKSIVLWQYLGKSTTKFRFRATPPLDHALHHH
jgi:hypothetical protein